MSSKRDALKRYIVEQVGEMCECCDLRMGTDLHEVFVLRSDLPKSRHGEIFVRGNCALVCRQCHDSKVQSAAFKARFRERLLALGEKPLEELE